MKKIGKSVRFIRHKEISVTRNSTPLEDHFLMLSYLRISH